MKWTHEMRKTLYSRLLAEFGPHNSWKGSRYPTDKRSQFRAALSRLASEFSAASGSTITPDAVEQQMDWGITVQKEMRDQSHVRNFILNKAAALEVGFVVSSDLPEFMSVRQSSEHPSRTRLRTRDLLEGLTI